MNPTIFLHLLQPRTDLSNPLLKHQVFCDGFRFRDVDSFEGCFIDFGLSFVCEGFRLPTLFNESFSDLFSTAGVKDFDTICEFLACLF
jgi:hypothetical protein